MKELIHVADFLQMSKLQVRNWIALLESEMSSLPQLEIPLKHYFSKGVYAREISIKAGSLIVGKIHRHKNMNILTKGYVSVLSTDGVVKLKAPCSPFVASAGVKRVIYAHEDSVWLTIHGTHETDLEKIENEFIAQSYEEV